MFYAGPDELRSDALPLISALNSKGKGGQYAGAVRVAFQQGAERFPRQLLSDENIIGGTGRMKVLDRQSRVYPQAGQRLAHVIQLLGSTPDTVALAVRDPADFLASGFSLQVTIGHELDFRDYLGQREMAAVSWSELAGRLLNVAGIKHLLVWRYEDYRALRPQLLTRLVPEGIADQIPEPAPTNLGLTQAALDWLMEQAMLDADSDLRQLAREAWRRYPKNKGYPGLKLIGEAEALRVRAAYDADIATLRQIPGVEFLSP